ncbi:DUF86 domain-containing protein [Sulfurovum sp.]|uniref:type VII toxin-antitoxin system HepT family RNase toxin n=1 Tax=Sulfurovum sp. TaxID=1969726 RepID=UPI0025FE7B02|nr:DUF86 domain-containing protein [Sulfurovum sp.]
MPNVVLNKIQTIEKCLKRIREEYIGYEESFEENYTKQDSVILNLERASQASIDIATHIVKTRNLGLPNSSRELFSMLLNAGIISEKICKQMQGMVGFRNIAVHDYQNLNIEIVVAIVENHLGDFEGFVREVFEGYLDV